MSAHLSLGLHWSTDSSYPISFYWSDTVEPSNSTLFSVANASMVSHVRVDALHLMNFRTFNYRDSWGYVEDDNVLVCPNCFDMDNSPRALESHPTLWNSEERALTCSNLSCVRFKVGEDGYRETVFPFKIPESVANSFLKPTLVNEQEEKYLKLMESFGMNLFEATLEAAVLKNFLYEESLLFKAHGTVSLMYGTFEDDAQRLERKNSLLSWLTMTDRDKVSSYVAMVLTPVQVLSLKEHYNLGDRDIWEELVTYGEVLAAGR